MMIFVSRLGVIAAYLTLGFYLMRQLWNADWDAGFDRVAEEMCEDPAAAKAHRNARRVAKSIIFLAALLHTLFWPLWLFSNFLLPKKDI